MTTALYTPSKIGIAVVCGRKHCASCGRWRHLVDFHPVRRANRIYADAYCRACRRVRKRNDYAKRRLDREWMERKREYYRFWTEVRRRRAGIPPRTLKHRPVPDDPPWRHPDGGYVRRRVPTAPLVPVVELWLREYAAEHPAAVNGRRGVMALARRASVPERRINGVLRLETATTHYVVADRLAVAMGLTLTLIYPDL